MLVPRIAPHIAARPSQANVRRARGMSPCASTTPAFVASATRVPVASKKSTKKNVKTTESTPSPSAAWMSSAPSNPSGRIGSAATPCARPANGTSPCGPGYNGACVTMPSSVDAKIAYKTAPGTRSDNSTADTTSPKTVMSPGAEPSDPERHVRGRIRRDDARVLEPDEREKHADSGRDRDLEMLRDGADHGLTHARATRGRRRCRPR